MCGAETCPWQVFFHYGQPPIKSHLAEVLNYSVFIRHRRLHDPGTVGYGSPLHRNYYIQGLCHNVPLSTAKARSSLRKVAALIRSKRTGELLEFSVDPPRVTAAHATYRRDAKATLAIQGDRLVDLVTVESTTGKPQKLGLALHVQGKVRLPKQFKEDTQLAAERPTAFEYWTHARAAGFEDEAAFDVDYGPATIRITFAVPGEF